MPPPSILGEEGAAKKSVVGIDAFWFSKLHHFFFDCLQPPKPDFKIAVHGLGPSGLFSFSGEIRRWSIWLLVAGEAIKHVLPKEHRNVPLVGFGLLAGENPPGAR
jgi:hypothetical protein